MSSSIPQVAEELLTDLVARAGLAENHAKFINVTAGHNDYYDDNWRQQTVRTNHGKLV